MLPSRGQCHAVFLLNHTALLRPRVNIEEWVDSARAKTTIMVRALDLRRTAAEMLALGLVTCEPEITPISSLRELGGQADRRTLVAIARLLLNRVPPPWLGAAVDGSALSHEYIPSDDLAALSWLDRELEELLVEAHRKLVSDDDELFLKRFGEAAELIVLDFKRRVGAQPIHVATISDAYGYDIECRSLPTERIEVKAATERTKATIHLTRNEFDKSRIFRSEWRLVQVVFSTDVFVTDRIDAKSVKEVRRLAARALDDLVPADTAGFRWTKSAVLSPPLEAWQAAEVVVHPEFYLDGFRRGQRPGGRSRISRSSGGAVDQLSAL